MAWRRSTTAFVVATAMLLVVPGLVPIQTAVGSRDAPPVAWPLDRDGNGLDDDLDRALADGTPGLAYLHVHYARRPTADDTALLADRFGATRTYVFAHWDDVQVEIPFARAAELAEAPGVWGVEMLHPATLDLATSVSAIRASPYAGATTDGLDHTLAAHAAGFRGEGMVIAILDTGIDNLHRTLDDLDDDPTTNDPKLVTGADFSLGFSGPACIDPEDNDIHGTHVASTAAGTDAGGLLPPGVAPKARLVDLRVLTVGGLGVSWPTGASLALDWVLSYNAGTSCFGPPGPDGIDVVSMSLSLDTGNPQSSIAQKINDVVRSGVTVVISAGNAGPGALTLTKGPDGAILVANGDDRATVSRDDDRLASSSSRGPRLDDGDLDFLDELRPDIAAPGTAIEA
ncbi:MAG: S8 family serine peptidase, partial [Methanobacteriota archaeon]